MWNVDQRQLRLCHDDPLLLPGAIPRHLHPPLHLPALRHHQGRPGLHPLLDHRPPRLHSSPPVHQVGIKHKILTNFVNFFNLTVCCLFAESIILTFLPAQETSLGNPPSAQCWMTTFIPRLKVLKKYLKEHNHIIIRIIRFTKYPFSFSI